MYFLNYRLNYCNILRGKVQYICKKSSFHASIAVCRLRQ